MSRRPRRSRRRPAAAIAGVPDALRGWRTAAVLSLFALVFAALAIAGYRNTSATYDEPVHFTAGYVALTQRDFRVDPSHPPLLRMWASLPVLAMRPLRVDTQAIDQATSAQWLARTYDFVHRVMYVDNDADRVLGPARAMVVLLGVTLGVLVFSWAREWLGPVPAVTVLALFVLEPNLLAHASVVTTDLGVTTFMFGTVYFLWRTLRRATPLNVVAMATCCGLALASKFSAILLGPILLLLLAGAVVRRELPPRRAVALAVLLATAATAAIWASYGFRYLPSPAPGWSFDFSGTVFAARSPALADAVAWVDDHRLLPNAYVQGFLYTQGSAQMPAFLAGAYSANGWWSYFPIALLIKSPIAHLLLVGVGLLVCAARRRTMGALTIAGVLVPTVVYLGVAMATGINIGLRHILPIYPFLLLIAAAAVKHLVGLPKHRGTAVVGLLLALGAAEFATAYPHSDAFFNRLVGGPAHGFRYLVDSNLGWGRNLRPLKTWMDQNHVSHVNLAYFGQADPAYYGLDCTHLPGAPGFAIDRVARPRLPGYVAISPTILHGVYAPDYWRLFYRGFADLEPAAVIGHSMRVYWVEQWPEPGIDALHTLDATAHRDLADALREGLQWPEHAVVHYREYLRRRPGDATTLINLGLALVGSGRAEEALMAFHQAVAAQPSDGAARLILARALFANRNLAGAAEHAAHAARLLASDPDAHDFLGRVRAAQGLLDAALEEFQRALALDPAHGEARSHLNQLTSTR